MNREESTVHKTYKRRKIVYNGDVYKPDYGKGYRWLQIALFNLLERMELKRPYYETRESWDEEYPQKQVAYNFDTIELNALEINEVIGNTQDALNKIHYQGCSTIIIGRNMYRQIMSNYNPEPFAITHDIRYVVTENKKNKIMVSGIEVVFVPWFDGVLVMPSGIKLMDLSRISQY